MKVTAKVKEISVRDKKRTLILDSQVVQSITIATNPPADFEVEVGDTVDVHIADGRKVGVARHPK